MAGDGHAGCVTVAMKMARADSGLIGSPRYSPNVSMTVKPARSSLASTRSGDSGWRVYLNCPIIEAGDRGSRSVE